MDLTPFNKVGDLGYNSALFPWSDFSFEEILKRATCTHFKSIPTFVLIWRRSFSL